MFKMYCRILLLFFYCVVNAFAADILAIIPTASFSHQAPFRPLWRELSKKGHNITLITTDPMKDEDLKNIRQIDIGYGYEFMKKYDVIDIAMNDSKSFYEMGLAIRKASNDTFLTFLESSEGQNLINNKDNHFDLLLVEAQLPGMMVFSWKFDIPFIGICSLDCALQYHDTAGNLVHPVVTPDPNFATKNEFQLTFWERFQSSIYMFIYQLVIKLMMFPKEHKIWKKYFGNNVPSVKEVQDQMSMLFVATNPVFHSIRALMPNTITVGNGMHLSESQALTQDVKDFLDGADQGAIYFSLGSNIKGKHLNHTIKREIIGAFSKMPYRVLWKIDDKFDELPPNVKTSNWFSSQLDILRHPNVKLFITQGGLQSMQESVYANKPMIGISFFGDQHRNVNRMVHFKYGLKIDKSNITAESIQEAVTEVMTNPMYSINAKKYGEIFRDVDMSDVDKAVWWTEYVIRHKGAKHFRNPLLDMPFWKRYMLDVYGIILLGVLVIFKINLSILRLIKNFMKKRRSYGIEKKVK